MVGTAYQYGTDTFPKDSAKALHYFTIAAEHGDGKSASILAHAFYFGDGAPQDFVSALAWGTIAAGMGEDTSTLTHSINARITGDEYSQAIEKFNAIKARILHNMAHGQGY